MAKTKLALYDNDQISFFKADQLAVSALAYIKNTAGNLVMQAESTGKLNFKSSLLLDTGLTIGSAGSSSTLTMGNTGDIINLNASGVTYNIGTLTGSPIFTGNITTQGSGTNTFSGTTNFTGNVNFSGTTVELNVTNLTVDDKNIELGSVGSPTDITADGGGITLRGTTNKSLLWDDANDNWTSSEHWNLATGKLFKINNTSLFGFTDPYTISYQKFMIYGVRTSQNTSTEAFRISAFPADNQNYANNAFHIGFWDNNESGGVGGSNLAEAARISVKREEGWGALATRSAGFEFSTVLDGTLTPRVIISASGNLGIGTTLAVAALDLGSGTGGRSIVWGGPSGAAHYASIGTMYSNAHLFIGSALKLDTTASNILYSYSGTQAASGITFNFASGDITFLAEAVGAKTAGAVFNQTTNAKMIVRPSGNVGIGTLTPTARLSVQPSSIRQLDFLEENSQMTIKSVAPDTSYNLRALIIATHTLNFRTGASSGTTSTEVMRLSATGGLSVGSAYVTTDAGADNVIVSGKVGIGITAPVEKLEVNGNVKALSALLTGLSSYAVPYKSASTSYLENSAISYNPTNNFVGFNWTTMSRMIVWPNIYDTRANTYNAFLNSGDMLVNLVQRGGSVTVHNGLGPISEIEVYRTGLSTSTVINGGSGYAVNDVLTVVGGDNNATVTVASIDGSGKVLTVTITSAGTNYLTGPNISVTGGAGTGCKLYIKTVTGSARDATSYHSNLIAGSIFKPALSAPYWSSVTIANPVQVTIDLGGSIHMYRMMLIPGGRNQMPINYTIETYANDSYYGLARWHTQKTAVAESNTYIKLVEFTTQSEAILKIRITVTVSGDYDYTNTFSIQQLIGYERYIGNGRFTGYNMAVTGDTAYGDYIINGYVRATTNFLSGAGTVSSPAFTFINDSDTGIFNPTANTLAFSTAGSERVRIDSSGNVGIGTTSPTGLLDILIGSKGIFRIQDSPANTTNFYSYLQPMIFQSNYAGPSLFTFNAGAVNLVSILQNGTVGIGTTSPGVPLGVVKSDTGTTLGSSGVVLNVANVHNTTNNIAAISFGNSGGGAGWSQIGAIYKDRTGGSEDQDLFFRVIAAGSSSEVMRISNALRVGIGTNDPLTKLHVYDSVAGGLLTIQGVTGGQGFGLSLLNSAGTAYIRLLNDNGNLRIQTNTADHIINVKAAGSIGFGTESQSTSNRLSVNGAVAIGTSYVSTAAPANGLIVQGNVGIGASTLTAGLHINTGSAVTDTQVRIVRDESHNDADQAALMLESGPSTNTTRLNFGTNGDAGASIRAIQAASNSAASTELSFWTRGAAGDVSQRVVIDKDGNVGIGNTVPGYKLDVTGDVNISGHLYASVKHFRAEDPTNPNHYITYSSLEGPENAVFYRGKVNIKDNIYIIKLPKEWGWLVDSDSLSVYLSSEDDDQHLSYSIYNDTIKIKNNKMLSKHIKCSYLIMATRKDIKPLVVHT